MKHPEPMSQREFAQFNWCDYMRAYGPDAMIQQMTLCCPRTPLRRLTAERLASEQRTQLEAHGCQIVLEKCADQYGFSKPYSHITFPEGTLQHEAFEYLPSHWSWGQIILPDGFRLKVGEGPGDVTQLFFEQQQATEDVYREDEEDGH